jgi:hypothetical protein
MMYKGNLVVNSLSSLLQRPNFSPVMVPGIPTVTPIQVLSEASLLMVSEHKKSGLILCKEFDAQFAGPGAALGSPVEQPYKAVIAIGSPEIVEANSIHDRSRAYGLRIQWGRWLYKIADHEDPVVRVEKLLAGFEGFFGRSVVMSIPSEVMALLVGVLPMTVDRVKRRYKDDHKTLIFPCDQLQVTTLAWDTPSLLTRKDAPLRTQTTLQEIHQTYSHMLRSA